MTLAQTAERLETAQTIHDLPADDDAAMRLARILLSAGRIHFIIGRALNPHQVADVVRGEPMRMVYVRELIRALELRNKKVTLEYV